MSAPGPLLLHVALSTVLWTQYVAEFANAMSTSSVDSYARSAEMFIPQYPDLSPVRVLSALYASMAGIAARTFAFALSASCSSWLGPATLSTCTTVLVRAFFWPPDVSIPAAKPTDRHATAPKTTRRCQGR